MVSILEEILKVKCFSAVFFCVFFCGICTTLFRFTDLISGGVFTCVLCENHGLYGAQCDENMETGRKQRLEKSCFLPAMNRLKEFTKTAVNPL